MKIRNFYIKIFAMVLIAMALSLGLQAQTHGGSSQEIGYQIGTSYYIGDLNPSNPFKSRFHLAQGGFYRTNINSRIGVRFQVMNSTVEAWDTDSDNSWALNRNLHFRNNITEFSIQAEINYIEHVLGNPKHRFSGFLTAGFAYFTHDPEASDIHGNWHPLQPIGTEGQGFIEGVDIYKLGGFAMPYGIGFKVNLGTSLSFQLEWGMRKTWTDYLDDVSTTYIDDSYFLQDGNLLAAELADRMIEIPEEFDSSEGMQRGDPGRNDKYGYVLASISLRVSKKPTTCWEQ